MVGVPHARKPASELVNDRKFHNQSYINNQERAAKRLCNTKVHGSDVAVTGIDAGFHSFSTIRNWNKMCYDNCLSSAN